MAPRPTFSLPVYLPLLLHDSSSPPSHVDGSYQHDSSDERHPDAGSKPRAVNARPAEIETADRGSRNEGVGGDVVRATSF